RSARAAALSSGQAPRRSGLRTSGRRARTIEPRQDGHRQEEPDEAKDGESDRGHQRLAEIRQPYSNQVVSGQGALCATLRPWVPPRSCATCPPATWKSFLIR